jgi:hypothetical protein
VINEKVIPPPVIMGKDKSDRIYRIIRIFFCLSR